MFDPSYRLWRVFQRRRDAALLARLQQECDQHYHGAYRRSELGDLARRARHIRDRFDHAAFAEALERYAWTHQHFMDSSIRVLLHALAIQSRLRGPGSAAATRLNCLIATLPARSSQADAPDGEPYLRAAVTNDDGRVDIESDFWAARAGAALARRLTGSDPDTAKALEAEVLAHALRRAADLEERALFLWGWSSDPHRAYVWRHAILLRDTPAPAAGKTALSEMLESLDLVFAEHPFPPLERLPEGDPLWRYSAEPPIGAEVEPMETAVPSGLSRDVFLTLTGELAERLERLDLAEDRLRAALDLVRAAPAETSNELARVFRATRGLLQFLHRHDRGARDEGESLATELADLEGRIARATEAERLRRS